MHIPKAYINTGPNVFVTILNAFEILHPAVSIYPGAVEVATKIKL